MPRRTKEEAQLTHDRILMAALDVFSRKGFSRSTLADIARQVGMTKGAVYWHFKDKQDLLIELATTMIRKEEALVEAKIPSMVSLDDLLAYLVARADLVTENKEIRKFVVFLSLQVEWATETEILARAKERRLRDVPFRRIADILASARDRGEIRPGVDLAQVHDILVGLFTGMGRSSLNGVSQTPLGPGLRMAAKAILDSIRVRPETPPERIYQEPVPRESQ